MSEINLEFLKKHDFDIQIEQERAVLTLSKDKVVKLIVGEGGSPKIVFDNSYCFLNTDEFDIENVVKALKTLFKGQNTFPPF